MAGVRIEEIRERRNISMKQAARRYAERSDERAENRTKIAREGPIGADTQERVDKFREMAARRVDVRPSARFSPQERIIGPTLDFENRPPDAAGEVAGRPVCRIVELAGAGYELSGFATGFMITPRLLLTNHHVFDAKRATINAGAQFGYEYDTREMLRQGEAFELDPDAYFVANEELDFAIVAVKPRGVRGGDLSVFGYHKLIPQLGKILLGQPVHIVQHPDGKPKTWASRNNRLLDLLDNFLHYETDTMPGSSGSPALSEFWDVVGLHHSGVPEMRSGVVMNRFGQPWDEASGDDSTVNWIANEGVRVSRIVAALEAGVPPGCDPALHQTITGVDVWPVLQTGERKGETMPTTQDMVRQATGNPIALLTLTGNTVINIGPSAPPSPFALAPSPAPAPAPSPATRESLQALEKKLVFDDAYGQRQGYQTFFLPGQEVGLPRTSASRMAEIHADRHGNEVVLDYHHFSLAMNKEWRLQMWSAVNVDFRPQVRIDVDRDYFGKDDWEYDPRLPKALQLGDDEFYAPAKVFDRGHVVRRDDNEWGATEQEIVFANSDTFHWTNCTPQHERFNQERQRGVWGKLESHITRQANAIDQKAVLFAGPVLRNDDKDYFIDHDWGGGEVRVPLWFWKVVVVAERRDAGTALRAYGFVLDQKQAIAVGGLERFNVGAFRREQRTLSSITELTGVEFPPNVLAADMMTGRSNGEERRTIATLRDVAVNPTDLTKSSGGGKKK